MEFIRSYFPDLSDKQKNQYALLLKHFPEINARINLISRKDLAGLEEKHLLHSLGIALEFRFNKGARVLDLGTGGGFPGIPLAVRFPKAQFLLADSIGKKIKAVKELVNVLELKNVSCVAKRAEELNAEFDYVVSRAVAPFPKLISWCFPAIKKGQAGSRPNGLIALKGGDLTAELAPFSPHVEVIGLDKHFHSDFFSTKKIVYLKK